jgi:hypothetical protein
MSALRIVPSRIIVDVTVPVSPVVTTVPVTFGRVIVLSAVGSVTVSVVSNGSAGAPSNTMLESLRVRPVTVGVVIVGVAIKNS